MTWDGSKPLKKSASVYLISENRDKVAAFLSKSADFASIFGNRLLKSALFQRFRTVSCDILRHRTFRAALPAVRAKERKERQARGRVYSHPRLSFFARGVVAERQRTAACLFTHPSFLQKFLLLLFSKSRRLLQSFSTRKSVERCRTADRTATSDGAVEQLRPTLRF